MNVLSEFDGISCGQLALQRAGIFVGNYYASEIDKYAIQVAKKNFPKTIHLGDVRGWKSWDLPKIDLFIAGSPCQGFSNAGKGLNFNDPRSKLFFEFVGTLKMLRDKNPDLLFLLENVRMKQEWQDIISKQVGVKPIKINSALVSAQNRVRLYWTNIQGITQPEDKQIYLKDIIECGKVDRSKSYTIDANYFKGGNPRSNFEDGKRQLVFEHQSHKRAMVKVQGGALRTYPRHPNGEKRTKRLEIRQDQKSNTLTSVETDSLIVMQGAAIRNQVTKRGVEEQLNIRKDGKSNAVVPSYPNKLNGMVDGYHYRKLTPLECERLQTLPDNYTEGVSNTQRYKCVGNGWTVDVIAHIFSFMKVEK